MKERTSLHQRSFIWFVFARMYFFLSSSTSNFFPLLRCRRRHHHTHVVRIVLKKVEFTSFSSSSKIQIKTKLNEIRRDLRVFLVDHRIFIDSSVLSAGFSAERFLSTTGAGKFQMSSSLTNRLNKFDDFLSLDKNRRFC